MKLSLLQFLACTACGDEETLQLEEPVYQGEEVEAGFLRCSSCTASYPIRGFIPRFVGTDSYADSFGFEWNRFRKVQVDILGQTDESERTFTEKTGLIPEEVGGKLVLDAGGGAGRFAEVASRWGAADVVVVDLSSAVDACYQNIGQRANVHIVQADLFELPLRKANFDIVYSLGVLHHTPDTQKAFQQVSLRVKPKGVFAVYVYSPYSCGYKFSDVWRKLTVRLPKNLLYVFSLVAVPLYYVYRFPVLGGLMRVLFPISMHPKWRWRWLDTFDWYSPRYQQKRIHSALGYLTPAEFEAAWVQDQTQATLLRSQEKVSNFMGPLQSEAW